LPTNNQLENINFADNLLTTFDYTQLNPQTCTDLRLFNNQFAATDLSVFSPLVNLTDLDIGDTNNDNLNKFFGSLEALKNCAKLKTLDIRNTNVNQGLEYLPASLENFAYSSLAGSNFQVQELEREINK
jgi:hypothetical protein